MSNKSDEEISMDSFSDEENFSIVTFRKKGSNVNSTANGTQTFDGLSEDSDSGTTFSNEYI